jgi:hypothetical protein
MDARTDRQERISTYHLDQGRQGRHSVFEIMQQTTQCRRIANVGAAPTRALPPIKEPFH